MDGGFRSYAKRRIEVHSPGHLGEVSVSSHQIEVKSCVSCL